jgi:hypothetical protein
MPAKLGPWLAAALAGAVALGVSFGLSALLPVEYSASGRLDVPAAALRATRDTWPNASQINRWLAQPLPVRPLVKVALAEEDKSAPPQILVTAQAGQAEAAAESVNQVLRTAQRELQSAGVKFDEERHRALLTLLHRARAQRTRVQRELDRLVATRMREVAANAEGNVEAPVAAPPEIASPTVVSVPAAPTVRARNPLYDDLLRQIGQMEGRRAGLLQTMTPAHPVIRDLDWRLGQLQEQLRTSPEYTSAPDPAAVGRLPFVPVETAPTSVPNATAMAEPTVALDDLRKQRALVAAADMRLGTAIQQERDAWQQLSSLRAALESNVVLAAVPARPDESVAREQLRWAGVLVALAAFGGTLWGFRPRNRKLRTAEDIRRTLNVPVLGKVSAAR